MQRAMGEKRANGIPDGSNHKAQASNGSSSEDFDVLVVGAGFAGCYLLHHFRKNNFKVKVVEAGSDLGGVWHWNRYPGARVDSQYPVYALSIPEVWKDWYWTEQYPGVAELQRYFAHMESVLHLKKDIEFDTKVVSADFDEKADKWNVHYDDGRTVRTSFFIGCLGFAAKRHFPDWKGLDTFQGVMHHSSFWPTEGVKVKGKRLAVVGTGATGIQIAQECAKDIGDEGSITVFQRTPNISYPMCQAPLTKEQQDSDKENFDEMFKTRSSSSYAGNLMKMSKFKASDHSEEEREAFFEALWKQGGFRLHAETYMDMATDAKSNRMQYDFWARKVRARITDDAEARDILAPLEPPHIFAGKRPSLEQDFYEQFNRPNINVVDVKKAPITEVTPQGIVTADGKHREFDIIALATGFDAVTGGIKDIDIRGIDGESLSEKWREGTHTYLGMTSKGFPNFFFLYGPQSPTAFSSKQYLYSCCNGD